VTHKTIVFLGFACIMAVYTYTTGVQIKMEKENITSQITGTNQVFGISKKYEAGTIVLYWNGIRQIVSVSYSELNDTQIYTNFVPAISDYLEVEYIKK
jgi:hypothetical protein